MADQVLIVSFQPFHIADFLICQISDSKKRIFPVHLFWFSGATVYGKSTLGMLVEMLVVKLVEW